jgi:Rps23 Pro-64 3,4-dihydroxylase Tpa1-like proline 4-hydroxylase
MHGKGGKLNIHQDYSIHPKIPYERKLNIIIHLSQNWKPEWGGGIEFWSHNEETNKPKEMVKKYDLKFNRAVIFDTTQHSWHGLPEPLKCPEDHFRKTLAIYYVQSPSETVCDRFRALFVPTKEQENDASVLDLIEKRKSIKR